MSAIKFVMHGALGGGGPLFARDNLGKTLGAALLRMWVDLPDDVASAGAPPARPRWCNARTLGKLLGMGFFERNRQQLFDKGIDPARLPRAIPH